METKQILILCTLLIVGVVLLVSARNISENGLNSVSAKENTYLTQNTNTAPVIKDGVQYVKLKFNDYGYVVEPSALKVGVPVKMEVDLSTVTGCMRSVIIPAFNIRKNVYPNDNIIEFIPDKTGTFRIHCSMNMGQGSFTVVDDNGQKSDYVETKPVNSGGSCGASGGGCGCGGGKL